jgi:cytochrome c biogenesis protein
MLSRFGVYITHVSILIIFFGAIIGNLFGFKGYMAITEGETSNQMYVRQDKMIDTVSASLGSFFSGEAGDSHQDPEERKYKTLPFSIRCDDFDITYYANTGRPKDYTSDLLVIRDGEEVAAKTIEVNDPLIVDKIYFYQSNYGPSGRPGLVALEIAPPGGTVKEYRVPVNGSFQVEGTGTHIQVQSFIPDFTIVNNQVIQRSSEMVNPAVYIEAKNKEKLLFNGWIFPKYPDYSTKTEDYQVDFKDYWGWQYTGLQVAYDPGVEVVWIGCTLLVVGLMISFFHSHQRIWARVRGKEIVLAGSAHKNRMAFEKKFNRLTELIRK